MSSARPRDARLLLAVAFAVAAMLPAALAAWGRDYWRPDEPDYAQHVREMVQRGDWVVPYQNGEPFPEKPILTYWGAAAMTPFTGGVVTPFGTRVQSLLGGALLVLVAIRAAEWLGAGKDRWLAGAATAVAPIAFWEAQFLQMDALFSGLLGGALLIQLKLETDEERHPWLALAGHVLLGLAVLTKGPLALAISVLVAGTSVLATRSWRPVTALYPVRAALVVTAVAAPWYVLSIHRFGWHYAYELIIRHNLVRFANAWDHIHPFWYYAANKVWADFFPWTLPVLVAIVALWKGGEASASPRLRSLLRAVGVSFLLFSASRSKQGKYLLVLYPFLAAVLALVLTRVREGRAEKYRRARGVLAGVLAFLAVVLVLAAVALHPVAMRKVRGDVALVPWVAVPLGLGGLAALALLARRRDLAPAALALAGGLWLGEAALGAKVLPALNDRKTARPMYERLRPHVRHGEPLAYASGRFRCYALVVLDRRLDWVKTPAALLEWIGKHPDGWVIAGKSEYDEWLAKEPALRALPVRDAQPEGSDTGLVLRLAPPAE